MRKVTYYIAYDDTEFTDREECMKYEDEVVHNLAKVDQCYIFYDKNMNPIHAPSIDAAVEDWLDWLTCACDQSTHIKRVAQLTKKIEMCIRDEIGYCILNEDFDYELGMFKWDPDKVEWVKVDE